MKYLCLIRIAPPAEPPSPAEAAARFDEYREFTEAIRASGHFVAANRLHPAASAVTVRVRQGSVTATDGPYAETKEQLGGYYIIDARDLNEAIQVAAKIPGARHGSVEVRAVLEDPPTRQMLGDPQ